MTSLREYIRPGQLTLFPFAENVRGKELAHLTEECGCTKDVIERGIELD